MKNYIHWVWNCGDRVKVKNKVKNFWASWYGIILKKVLKLGMELCDTFLYGIMVK